MSIRSMLEERHSKEQAEKIVRYIKAYPDRFSELVTIFIEGPYRLTQRAAWPLGLCAQVQPQLFQDHLPQLIQVLEKEPIHDAVIRNVIRTLQFVDIPENLHGRVMDRCFEYILSNDTAVAIKAFSLTVLEKLSVRYPDIKQELRLVIEERLPHESAAFASRARKILKKLDPISTRRN